MKSFFIVTNCSAFGCTGRSTEYKNLSFHRVPLKQAKKEHGMETCLEILLFISALSISNLTVFKEI